MHKENSLNYLLGPFIDSEHPEIKKGALNRTYDEVFRLDILRRLQDYVEYMGPDACVILVPSIHDAHLDFVFPQPAFDINLADPDHQITCITNPGMFSANKVNIELQYNSFLFSPVNTFLFFLQKVTPKNVYR